MEVLAGTDDGLRTTGRSHPPELPGRAIVALAPGPWAIADDGTIWRSANGSPALATTVERGLANCLLPLPDGTALVGTAEARLLRLAPGEEPAWVASFDGVEGRDRWYTPWGGPPDTRSLARGLDGTLYANVHVGGILRSADDGATWEPTPLDIDADIHQVLAHPERPSTVLAAGALGLAVGEAAGDTWEVLTDGLHATYSRAVAVADEGPLITASTGPRGSRARVYRLRGRSFHACEQGLPQWFDGNIDSHCLAASGAMAAFGTAEGDVYLSLDSGETWERAAHGLPPVRCLILTHG